MRLLQRTMGVAAAGFMLMACGGDDEGSTQSSGTSDTTSQSPIATYHRSDDPNTSYPGAMLQGVLVIEDGCLYLEDDRGKWLALLPSTVEWNESSQTLNLDGTSAAVGETVVLGGGEITNLSMIEYAPQSCDTAQVWAAHVLDL